MTNKLPGNFVRMLPPYFKLIGLLVILLTIAVAIILVNSSREWLPDEKTMIKIFTKNGLLAGLLLIALAKEKLEDEMMVSLRLKSAGSAMIMTSGLVIFSPLISLILKKELLELDGPSIISFMLVFYIFMYQIEKRKL